MIMTPENLELISQKDFLSLFLQSTTIEDLEQVLTQIITYHNFSDFFFTFQHEHCHNYISNLPKSISSELGNNNSTLYDHFFSDFSERQPVFLSLEDIRPFEQKNHQLNQKQELLIGNWNAFFIAHSYNNVFLTRSLTLGNKNGILILLNKNPVDMYFSQQTMISHSKQNNWINLLCDALTAICLRVFSRFFFQINYNFNIKYKDALEQLARNGFIQFNKKH